MSPRAEATGRYAILRGHWADDALLTLAAMNIHQSGCAVCAMNSEWMCNRMIRLNSEFELFVGRMVKLTNLVDALASQPEPQT